MNPEANDNPEQDIEALAVQLEKLHQQMLDSRDRSGDQTPATLADVPTHSLDLESAAELIRLLDSMRPLQNLGDTPSSLNRLEHDGATGDKEPIAETGKNVDERPQPDSQSGPREFDFPKRLNRFEILRPLGQGGYGSVFLAKEVNLNREVAIKFPNPQVLTRVDLKQRFIRESRAASLLSHPNIIAIYEAGNDRGIYFLATEYVNGSTLESVLSQSGQPDVACAADIIITLADAMAHAHDRGVLHRDLKPANILIKLDDAEENPYTNIQERIRIADFGLASDLRDSTQQTRSGAMIGTPAYMAPEQISGISKSHEPACDIYSLGCILYRLLVGVVPFEFETTIETMRAVQDREPKAPRRINPNVPKDLEAVCLKCLSKKPRDRYPSAFDLAEDLRRWRRGFPVIARPVTWIDRTRRWIGRNTSFAAVLGLLAIATVIALTASWIGWSSTSSALAREKLANEKAKRNYDEYRQAVDTFFVKVTENPSLNALPGNAPLRKELLTLALDYYQEFEQENPDDPALALDLADTQVRIGKILQILGKPHDAVVSYEQALQVLENAESALRPLDYLQVRATALNGLAVSYVSLGETTKAAALNLDAIQLQTEIMAAGNNSEADEEKLARFHSSHGFILKESGLHTESKTYYEKAVQIYASLSNRQPGNSEWQAQKLYARHQVENALLRLGQEGRTAAEATMDETISQLRVLVVSEPTRWSAMLKLADALVRKSSLAFADRKPNQALPLLKESLEYATTLTTVHPYQTNYLEFEDTVHGYLVAAYSQNQQKDEARRHLKASLEIADELSILDPNSTRAIRALARSRTNMGSWLAQHHVDLEKAQAYFEESREQYLLLQKKLQNQLETQRGIATSSTNLAKLIQQSDGDLSKALEYADEAVELLDRLAVKFPKDARFRFEHFNAVLVRGGIYRNLKNYDQAISDFRRSLKLSPPPFQKEIKAGLATILLLNMQPEEAFETVRVIEATLSEKPDPSMARLFTELALFYANAQQELGDAGSESQSKAMQYVRKALQLNPKIKSRIDTNSRLSILRDFTASNRRP